MVLLCLCRFFQKRKETLWFKWLKIQALWKPESRTMKKILHWIYIVGYACFQAAYSTLQYRYKWKKKIIEKQKQGERKKGWQRKRRKKKRKKPYNLCWCQIPCCNLAAPSGWGEGFKWDPCTVAVRPQSAFTFDRVRMSALPYNNLQDKQTIKTQTNKQTNKLYTDCAHMEFISMGVF